MIIKNKKALATSKLRKDALDIIENSIQDVQPEKILKRKISFDRKKKLLTINKQAFPVNHPSLKEGA